MVYSHSHLVRTHQVSGIGLPSLNEKHEIVGHTKKHWCFVKAWNYSNPIHGIPHVRELMRMVYIILVWLSKMEWSPVVLQIVRKGTDSFSSISVVSCRHDTWSPAKVGPMILACFGWWPRRTSSTDQSPRDGGSFVFFEIAWPKSRYFHDDIFRFLSAISFTGINL